MGLPMDEVDVEIAPGADLSADPSTWPWVNLCAASADYPDGRVQRPVTIHIGGESEGSSAGPSWCEFTIRNEDGALTPSNPLGPWFGLLGRGTPLRVTWSTSDRFLGLISELPTTWLGIVDNSRVRIRADGETRRLGQGGEPLDSALYHSIVNNPDVVAYWPGEEPAGATLVSSPIQDVASFRPVGVEFGSGEDVPAGSQPGLIRVVPGATNMWGVVPSVSASQWLVAMLFRADSATTNFSVAMKITTSSMTASRWEIWFTDTQIRLQCFNHLGTAVVTNTQALNQMWFGRWWLIRLSLAQSGTAVDWSWTVTDATDETSIAAGSGTLSSATVGIVRRAGHQPGAAGPDSPDRWFGHITVLRGTDTAPTFDADAVHGYAGETAGDRFERLCTEAGVRHLLIGDAADTEPMGPQRADTLLANLRDVEAADGGILTDLTYRTRADLYNQTPVEIEFCDLNGAPELLEDDQSTRNDVTVSRPAGSSARVVDDEHIRRFGRYDESVELNLATDRQSLQAAAWRVGLGTTTAARWPTVPLSINTETQHLLADWLALSVGDRIQIPHDVPQLPGVDVDLLVQGWTETIYSRRAERTLNCTPAAPYSNLFTVEDDPLGRLESQAYLAVDIDGDDTTFNVVIPVRRALNPRPDFEGSITAVDFSVASPRVFHDYSYFGGTFARSSEQAFRGSWSGKLIPDGTSTDSQVATARVPFPAAGRNCVGSVWVYSPTGGFDVLPRLRFLRESNIAILGTTTGSAVALSADQWVRIHLAATPVAGSDAATFELILPGISAVTDVVYVDEFDLGWQGQPFDTAETFDIVVGGEVMSVTAVGAMGSTGLQQLTVTRSGNGITKSHPAGTDVRLYPSLRLAL